MALTGTLNISGSVTGGAGGPKTISPARITLPAAVEDRISVVLAEGDNTIDVPAGATICVVVPPANNQVALATGTDGADPKAPNVPWVQTFPAGATSFVVHAAAALAAAVVFDFA